MFYKSSVTDRQLILIVNLSKVIHLWGEISIGRLLIWITYIAFIVNLMTFLTLKIDQLQVKVYNNNSIMLGRRWRNTRIKYSLHIKELILVQQGMNNNIILKSLSLLFGIEWIHRIHKRKKSLMMLLWLKGLNLRFLVNLNGNKQIFN